MNVFKTGLLCAVAALTANSANGAIIISEYVEGSGFNKAIEFTNTGSSSVDLTGYQMKVYFNGSITAGGTYTFGAVNLASGASFVLVTTDGGADDGLEALADDESSAVNWNGDDAIELTDGTNVIDSFGQVGFDPGSAWSVGGVQTQDRTLVRKSTVLSGDTNSGNAFDPSVEWDSYAQNTFSNLGSHTFVPEPGSLALLGLGGLLVARRRRSA